MFLPTVTIAVEDNSENPIVFFFQSKLSAEAMKELCVVDGYLIKSLFLPSVCWTRTSGDSESLFIECNETEPKQSICLITIGGDEDMSRLECRQGVT